MVKGWKSMRISLRMKMLIMSFIVVSISIITSGWIMVHSISDAFEEELGERARAIARTVAQMPNIRNSIGIPDGARSIQPIAERTRLATNVDYIVIIDMNRIRYSHPSASLIGREFVGGDERASLAEHEYISKAKGTLGYSVRAFVPIMDEEGVQQVGVAVVGILTPTLQSLVAQYQNEILLSLIWGLLIGLLGSLFLAHNIKRQTLNLEPYQIAKLVEERSAVMQAMDMGIIALDEQSRITFMNRLAKEFTQRDKEKSEEEQEIIHLADVFPTSWKNIVSFLKNETNHQSMNRQIVLYDKTYLISYYHIHVKGQLVGSFITMIDRTEANRLAEELTGVKTLVDALRAQNHEYLNKLHSIAGLIQLERSEEALQFIIDETIDEENIIQFLKDHILEYSVSGLLLGKRSRAKELGVQFQIDRESFLHQIVDGCNAGDVVTLLGNLLENAFEAFSLDCEDKLVECFIAGDEQHLTIIVRDHGKGISLDEQLKIFNYGFSTKNKEGRGIGLALVKEIVETQQGEIMVDTEIGKGTVITININRKIQQ
jgi:two-component system, CitB family, sensor histidine kinase DctS